jgi:hypothetical protein
VPLAVDGGRDGGAFFFPPEPAAPPAGDGAAGGGDWDSPPLPPPPPPPPLAAREEEEVVVEVRALRSTWAQKMAAASSRRSRRCSRACGCWYWCCGYGVFVGRVGRGCVCDRASVHGSRRMAWEMDYYCWRLLLLPVRRRTRGVYLRRPIFWSWENRLLTRMGSHCSRSDAYMRKVMPAVFGVSWCVCVCVCVKLWGEVDLRRGLVWCYAR